MNPTLGRCPGAGRPLALFVATLVLACLAGAWPVRAGTYFATIQPNASAGKDAWIQFSQPTKKNGGDKALQLQGGVGQRDYPLLEFSLPIGQPFTVLDARLMLRIRTTSGTGSLDTRVFGLTQSWYEPQVTWQQRQDGPQLWSSPGGTFWPYDSDRQVRAVSDTGWVSWQVGPLVNAWFFGGLPNDGFLIRTDSTGSARQQRYYSSDEGAAPTYWPKLQYIYTTDPPAVVYGFAEISPPAIHVNATNATQSLWLVVDALDNAPSGKPTGFNEIIVVHNGAIHVNTLGSITVGSRTIGADSVSWVDDGTKLTIKLPNIKESTKVHVTWTADELAPANPNGIDFRTYVDDTTTPVFAQVLWPANCDGIVGNGDHWIVTPTASPAVRVDLQAPVSSLDNHGCTTFTLIGYDAGGNGFSLAPDSIVVSPPSAGTIAPDGRFCALTAGTVTLIGYSGSLRDTTTLQILPTQPPTLSSLELRDKTGLAVSALAPADTMLLEGDVADLDGFRDVNRVDVELAYTGHAGAANEPAFHAAFRWTRGAATPWTRVDPAAGSWRIVPALCVADTASNVTTPRTVRFAIVPGDIARASTSGDWTMTFTAVSGSEPGGVAATSARLDMPSLSAKAHVVGGSLELAGQFLSGPRNSTHMPIVNPADGAIGATLLCNTPAVVEASIAASGGGPTITWGRDAAGTGGGTLGTTYVAISDTLPAAIDETPVQVPVYLWADYPFVIFSTHFLTQLQLRARTPDAGTVAAATSVSLDAYVSSANPAAASALAEITPNSVAAGTAPQTFQAWLLPSFGPGNTGVDEVFVSVPAGYGTPQITGVSVNGAAVAFTDSSRSGMAIALLGARVTTSQRIGVGFTATVPTVVDTAGLAFPMLFDDHATAIGRQPATMGDADGVPDADSWVVRVSPGPAATLKISPRIAYVRADSAQQFTVVVQDRFGNLLPPTASFAAQGGVGAIDGSGLFTAVSPGWGTVTAKVGGIADTATVRVLPARGIEILAVDGPATVYQGQRGLTFTARLENLGTHAVRLDSLALTFSRGATGDANGEFAPAGAFVLPLLIQPGEIAVMPFSIDVEPDATPAPLAVAAWAAGVEPATGIDVTASGADTALVLHVGPGAVRVTATQSPRDVRPGEAGVEILDVVLDNQYPVARTLTSLSLRNLTVGTGSRADLDAELGEVAVYLDDDGDGVLGPHDALLFRASAIDSVVLLRPLSAPIPAHGAARLFITCDVPIQVRDGDQLDVGLPGAGDVTFDDGVASGSWPVSPSGRFSIDGLVAAQVVVAPVPGLTVSPGTTDRLALAVRLPSNGYTADVLEHLAVVNRGTARALLDVTKVSVWMDNGDGVFDALADRRAGTLSFTGDRWETSSLSEAIPVGGAWAFVTVDVDPAALEGGGVRLALPVGASPAVGMRSGDSGPLDAEVGNPATLTLSGADRILFTPAAGVAGTVRPGQRGAPLLHVTATNAYSVPQTLTGITFTNATVGAGITLQLDSEFRSLALGLDMDGDQVWTAADSVVGRAVFAGGRASFLNLSLELPPGEAQHFFLLADVSGNFAADGDELAATLDQPEDVSLSGSLKVAGRFPIAGAAGRVVDGFVASQIVLQPTPSAAVSPGDGPLPALDFVLPGNGYYDDILRSVRLVNVGDTQASDLVNVLLWRDGGDGVFTGAGDDVLLGPLTGSDSTWQSPLLNTPVTPPGMRCFVSVGIAAGAVEGHTLSLSIPPGGIAFESGNDGPLDGRLLTTDTLVVSRSPLLASIVLPPASVVGTVINARMTVRNVGNETISGIAPATLATIGAGGLAAVAGPSPPTLTLAPGQSDTIGWQYQSTAGGEVRLAGDVQGTGSPSGLVRRSPRATSNPHRVYESPANVGVFASDAMPSRVTAGQTVLPMTLTLLSNGSADASDARVMRLKLHLEDETGAGIVPSSLLGRVVVSEGLNVYLSTTTVETSGSDCVLAMSVPPLVSSNQPTTLSLKLDLLPNTTVGSFRVVLQDSTSLNVLDATSGAPLLPQPTVGGFPIATAVTQIASQAPGLTVSSMMLPISRIPPGTNGVALATLHLANPGPPGLSSDVKVTAVTLALEDTNGVRDPAPGLRLDRLVLKLGSQTIAQAALTPATPDSFKLAFSQSLKVTAGQPLDLDLSGDVADGASLGWFRVAVASPGSVPATDINTRAALPVTFVPAPFHAGPIAIEIAATQVSVAARPAMPASLVIGETGATALTGVIRHPGGAGTAPVRLDSLTLDLRDEARNALVPSAFLNRVALVWNGVEIASLSSVPHVIGPVALAIPGVQLEAGDSARFAIQLDVNPAAPEGYMELMATGIHASDGNSGTAVTATAPAGYDLPALSGLARLQASARDLSVGLATLMPPLLGAGGAATPVARLTLVNMGVTGAGPILVDRLTIRAADALRRSTPLGAAASRLEAWVGGALWAASATLTEDSTTATLSAIDRITVLPGTPVPVELRLAVRAGASAAPFRVGCGQTDIGVVQPTGALLQVTVRPEAGAAFPLYSELGSVAATRLADSYANFPNPFAAGRGWTTFTFYLERPARVTLRVLTPLGDKVASLLDDAPLAAGLHQEQRWNGLNGRGDRVFNGVYVAEIVAHYDDGHSDRLLRKVAVVR